MPVLRLVDPRRLEVIAYIPVSRRGRVEPGAKARLVGTSDATLTVASRPTAVDAGHRFGARAPHLRGTGPALAVGTPVQVDIDTETHTGVVLIPSDAVVREGEETAVFVATGDKAERRAVTLGLADERRTRSTFGPQGRRAR